MTNRTPLPNRIHLRFTLRGWRVMWRSHITGRLVPMAYFGVLEYANANLHAQQMRLLHGMKLRPNRRALNAQRQFRYSILITALCMIGMVYYASTTSMRDCQAEHSAALCHAILNP